MSGRGRERSEVYPAWYPRLPVETLGDYLGERKKRIGPAVEAIDEAMLDRADLVDDVIETLEERFRLEEIVLGESTLDPQPERTIVITEDPRHLGFGERSRQVTVDLHTLIIPFTGEADLLRRWPPGVSASEPTSRTWIDPRFPAIRIPIPAGIGEASGSRLDRDFAEQDTNLRKLVTATNAAVAEWNGALPELVHSMVEARARRLGVREGIRSAIRFPTASASRAVTTRLPPKKKAAPRRVPQREHGDYPLLDDGDLAEVVAVIRRWADFIPGQPSVVRGKGENEMRDALLHDLNGHWPATGETFSKMGKADIRVVVAEAADTGVSDLLFKAECKIWDDAGCVTEAFEQLTERYLTNREHRTALIFFVRDAQRFRTAHERAVVRLVDRHGGVDTGEEMSGWPVVDVPHPDDHDRTVRVVVIVIDVTAPPEGK